MNLRQQADARPLLQMPAQGRAADLISGRFQTAPRRALSEKLTQGRQHPNRRRSGMAATLLRRGRAEIDNCRDEVQKPKIQHLLPCLIPQTWSFQPDNAPHQGCITAIPSNPSARDPTTHGISGNCLLDAEIPDPASAMFCAAKAIDSACSDIEWARARNVWGITQFHLGKLDEAIMAFTA